jgi:hypothetical protein
LIWFSLLISSDIGNSSNFNFGPWARFCMAGFGLFELGLELAALGPLFCAFLVIHNIQ